MLNPVRKTLTLMTLAAGMTTMALAQAGTTADAGAPASAAAANAGPAPTKVAVMNIQAVIANTNEFRRDFDILTKKYEPKSNELKGLSDELDSLKKQLNAQQDKLNETERATRLRAIEQKEKALTRQREDAGGEFQGEQDQLVQRVGEKVMQVVEGYAKQNNFAVVVDVSAQQGSVLWASERVNISKEVLDAFNAKSGVPAPAANAPSATKPPAPAKKPATTGTTPR